MTPHYLNRSGELNWLPDDLADRVPQVTKAVTLTRDGLAIDGAPNATAAADCPATRRALGGLRVQPLTDDGRSIRSGSVGEVVA